MKKLIIFLVALSGMQLAIAGQTANIKLKINGATGDNRYFLCLPNAGCLSVLNAQKGKGFPFYRPINMSSMFLADANNNFQLSPQNVPSSCTGTINTNQTMTISGRIVSGNNGTARVSQLRCVMS